MRESVIYQDIQQEKALSIVMRQLRHQVGTVPPAQVLKIQALESTQLDSLAEALLDFNRLADKDSLVSAKSSLRLGMRLNIEPAKNLLDGE